MMQSLHILRCALRGSLLPIHLEHRQAARSVRRNKRVWQVVALPLRLPLSPHALSTAGAVVRYLPCTKCFKAETSRSVLHCELEIYYHRLLSHIAVHSHYSPTAERIYRQWNTSANILRFALHCGQRHGSTSSDRSGSEQEIVPTP